ncbi:MAG TPA: DUF2378 family protein [Myxococcaceae bacterium]|nr:DUF2378 family protein [Myxococcaceae bacterium]
MGEMPSAGNIPAETTDYAVFEGMYRRALRLEPASPLAEKLREAGFDLKSPKGRYPTAVWKASLDAAAKHQYPHMPLNDGHRELGRLFTAGFFETIVGKVIGSIIPFLGTDRMMARMPKFASMATSGVTLETFREGEKVWRLKYTSRNASPDFMAGAIEGGVAKTKVPVKVEVQNRRADGFDIVVTEKA